MINYNPIKIKAVIAETPTTKSLVFDYPLQAATGQFLMVTDFQNGEKPFSISKCSGETFSLTIRAMGTFSTILTSLSVGDTIYFRGPYGNKFRIPAKNEKLLVIGGGCGTAPLRFLINTLRASGATNIAFINGAKTKDELLFHDELADTDIHYYTATNDGSEGYKGTNAELFKHLLKKESFDSVFSSGPELMLNAVYNVASENGIRGQYLLERYMKCGIGICGSCTIDPIGLRLCIDGPVIDGTMLPRLTEFGSYHRDASGQRVMLQC